ncbi:hypothetical protein BDW66DRAFT_133380 [Aspergillus desertorum]
MASRPTVSIASGEGKPTGATCPLPAVFNSPIRPDIVQYVRSLIPTWEEDENENGMNWRCEMDAARKGKFGLTVAL